MYKILILVLVSLMISCSSVKKTNRINANILSSSNEKYLFIYPVKYFSNNAKNVFKYSAIISDLLSDNGVESIEPFCNIKANSWINLYKQDVIKSLKVIDYRQVLQLKTEIKNNKNEFLIEMKLLNNESDEIVYLIKKSNENKLVRDLTTTGKIMLRFISKIKTLKKLKKNYYNPFYINNYNPTNEKINKKNINITEIKNIMYPNMNIENFKNKNSCIVDIE